MRLVVLLSAAFLTLLSSAAQPARQRTAHPKTAAVAVEQADRDFAQAMVSRDLNVLDETYADTYVFTNPSGRMTTKKELMDSFRNGVIKIESQQISEVQVQVYGNVAVETGKLVSRASWAGRDSNGTFRFTRVWLNAKGRWQTVAFQETAIK